MSRYPLKMLVFILLYVLAASASQNCIVESANLQLHFQPESGQFELVVQDSEKDTCYQIHARGLYLDGVHQKSFVPISENRFQNKQISLIFEKVGNRAIAANWAVRDGQIHNIEFIFENRDETDYFEYYGGGERYRALNHRGFILPMNSDNRWRNKGVGTYQPIPFIMSTQGYGVWVDSFVPGTFDLHATDRAQFVLRYPVKELRLVFIGGPQLAQILDDFTRLTGRPRVPPAWAFGLWKSRNVHANQDSVMVDIENHRRYDIPANVLVLDSPWEYGYNDFRINRQQFPKPEEMFDRIEELGFYTCLWLTSFINSRNVQDMAGIDSVSSNYAEAVSKGVLITDSTGNLATMKWWKGEGGLIDFTNPDAVAWYHAQLQKTRKYRAKAFKCDDGEGDLVPEATVADGTSPAEMNNRYSVLYNQAIQDFVDQHLNGDGVLLVRSGYTGNQKFPFTWAADNSASFAFADGLPSAILATQNMSLSGVPLFGADIAGYFGNQTKTLFLRWTQFGVFTPFFQVHMISNLGPWDFDTETTDIFRKFAKLRVQLFPYLYAAVLEANRSGMPVVRPMALAFQHDEIARQEIFQYLFGPDLLVAPIYQFGTHRSVYLPAGNWFDYWTGQPFSGPKLIEVTAPLDEIPLFVRAGAIIPMLPNDIHTLIPRHPRMSENIKAIDDDPKRILQIWPGEQGLLQSWEKISARLVYENGHARLKVSSAVERPLEIHLMYRRLNPPQITASGKPEFSQRTDRTIIFFDLLDQPETLGWKE